MCCGQAIFLVRAWFQRLRGSRVCPKSYHWTFLYFQLARNLWSQKKWVSGRTAEKGRGNETDVCPEGQGKRSGAEGGWKRGEGCSTCLFMVVSDRSAPKQVAAAKALSAECGLGLSYWQVESLTWGHGDVKVCILWDKTRSRCLSCTTHCTMELP